MQTVIPGQQMRFDLKGPCSGCPFRTDGGVRHLGRKRAIEITESLCEGATFPCHKTTNEDDKGKRIINPSEQMCGGAMVLLEKTSGGNLAMHLARVLRWYRGAVDLTAPVFNTFKQFIEAQAE